MKVAVIPARGGSKRIPRKNVRAFLGKPMIAYSIEAAINSGVFDQVIVSTEDVEIAQVAKTYGATAPFSRPDELSDDHTETVPVIKHAIEALGLSSNDVVCCLYATAPFVLPSAMSDAVNMLIDGDLDYVFPVTAFNYPIQRALKLDDDGEVTMFDSSKYHVRSQDLEPAFHDVGQFYVGCCSAWLNEKPIFTSHSKGVLIPSYLAQDIDDEEDWIRAELMYRSLKELGHG